MVSGDSFCVRVLVIDDDRDFVTTTTALLRIACDCDTRGCCDGAAALALVEEFRPHLVLLDLAMPKVSGLEIAERLAQRGIMPPLLVAASGFGDQDSRQRCTAAGFHRHELKPIEMPRLRELVRLAAEVASLQAAGAVAEIAPVTEPLHLPT